MFIKLIKRNKALFGLALGLLLAGIASGIVVATTGFLSVFGFSFFAAAASTFGIWMVPIFFIVIPCIIYFEYKTKQATKLQGKEDILQTLTSQYCQTNTTNNYPTPKSPIKTEKTTHIPSANQPIETLKNNIKTICKTKEMPNKTFLIWFGKKLPENFEITHQDRTIVINYWDNVVAHKNKNPNTEVHLIISKKLMEEKEFNRLKAKCEQANIILINFDENYKNCLNRDVVESFLKNPQDYACASDALRLALLFEQGGRYFDTDLEIIDAYHPKTAQSNAFLPEKKDQTYGFSIFSNRNQNSIEFHALQTCKEHPFFLLFLAASRYYSLKLLDAYKHNKIPNPCSKTLRQLLVMYTTGAAITYFNIQECYLSPIFQEIKIWNFEQKIFSMHDNHDHTWLIEEFTGHQYGANHEIGEATNIINNILLDDVDKEIGDKENRLSFMYKKAIEYFGEDTCKELTQILAPVLNQVVQKPVITM